MIGKTDKTISDKIVEETLATEKAYNKDLETLLIALIAPAVSKDNLQLHSFKYPIQTFYDISTQLICNVQANIVEKNSEKITSLRETRLQLLNQFFEVFKNYVDLTDKFNRYRPQDPNEFSVINEYIHSHAGMRDLCTLLMAPVVRFPRYLLLVNALIEHNDEQSLDIEQLNILKAFIQERLATFSSGSSKPIPAAEVPGYRLGDGIRYLIKGISEPTPLTQSSNAPISSEPYQFGDYARTFFGRKNGSTSTGSAPPPVSAGDTSLASTVTATPEPESLDDFVILNPASEPDGQSGFAYSLNGNS